MYATFTYYSVMFIFFAYIQKKSFEQLIFFFLINGKMTLMWPAVDSSTIFPLNESMIIRTGSKKQTRLSPQAVHTNNGNESINATTKKFHTLQLQLPMQEFLVAVLELTRKWSIDRNPIRNLRVDNINNINFS